MPTGGSHPDLLVDTSVAVALVVADHEHHAVTIEALGERRLGLAGHAAARHPSGTAGGPRIPLPGCRYHMSVQKGAIYALFCTLDARRVLR